MTRCLPPPAPRGRTRRLSEGPERSNFHIPGIGRPAVFKDAEALIRHLELRHWLEKEDLEFKSGVGWRELRQSL